MRKMHTPGLPSRQPDRFIRRKRRMVVAALMAAALSALAPLPVAALPHAEASSVAPSSGKMGWQQQRGRQTGLPVPRFVSLKSHHARMRIGPSFDYATTWIYTAPGLPLEILAEYGNWRQVRDCDGMTGWMHTSLLSGKRTAMIGGWTKEPVPLYNQASAGSRISAKLGPQLRLSLKECRNDWCRIEVPGAHVGGWLQQSSLCGVYPREQLGS